MAFKIRIFLERLVGYTSGSEVQLKKFVDGSDSRFPKVQFEGVVKETGTYRNWWHFVKDQVKFGMTLVG